MHIHFHSGLVNAHCCLLQAYLFIIIISDISKVLFAAKFIHQLNNEHCVKSRGVSQGCQVKNKSGYAKTSDKTVELLRWDAFRKRNWKAAKQLDHGKTFENVRLEQKATDKSDKK